MNREIWKNSIVDSRAISEYPCPRCSRGNLALFSEQREKNIEAIANQINSRNTVRSK